MHIDWKNALIILAIAVALIAAAACKAFADGMPLVTYTSPDQIKWVCEGSQGDEDVSVKAVTPTEWDFRIVPNTAKLSTEEIRAYPFELFRLETVGSRTIKTPLEIADFSTLSSDTKLGDTRLSTNSVDLSKYDGVTVKADPRQLAGAYLKFGVHSATYSAVSNVITVTGTTSQLREDIYTADQANGWGVFSRCSANAYCSDARIDIGDGSTATEVSDEGGSLTWSDLDEVAINYHLMYVNNATATFGLMLDADDKQTSNGVSFVSNSDFGVNFDGTDNGNAYFNSCTFATTTNILLKVATNAGHLWNCAFLNGAYIGSGSSDRDIYNADIYDSSKSLDISGDTVANVDVVGHRSYSWGIGIDRSCEISEVRMSDVHYEIVSHDHSGTVTLKNCYCLDDQDWAVLSMGSSGTPGPIIRYYSLDATVTTDAGTPIEAASVVITAGGESTTMHTSSAGTIDQQWLEYGRYTPSGYAWSGHTPYTLDVSKYGYLPYTAELDMGAERDLHIALQTISGTDAGDVLTWLVQNDASISWWEENMEFIGLILLVAVMLMLAYWADTMMVYLASGFGVGFIGLQWIDDGAVEMGLGITILVLAAWLLLRGILQPITGHVRM